ncbi:hypothetical protein B0T18DRAFT_442795 [Schizothecium vesticola]|uniref:Uncharacterized protein n=1 Tax=Schizothecium vesticola TaxID=314040 RepID=A0AA40FAX3_9PEZI|nr:hypothetical protein B0T18DRAFT_442795 [Schizothecium vesticola]
MKSIALALAAILAPEILATPTPDSHPRLQLRGPSLSLDALPPTPLTWTASIASNPSGPLRTFTGTAQFIYQQILAANPSYATLHPLNATAPPPPLRPRQTATPRTRATPSPRATATT